MSLAVVEQNYYSTVKTVAMVTSSILFESELNLFKIHFRDHKSMVQVEVEHIKSNLKLKPFFHGQVYCLAI